MIEVIQKDKASIAAQTPNTLAAKVSTSNNNNYHLNIIKHKTILCAVKDLLLSSEIPYLVKFLRDLFVSLDRKHSSNPNHLTSISHPRINKDSVNPFSNNRISQLLSKYHQALFKLVAL